MLHAAIGLLALSVLSQTLAMHYQSKRVDLLQRQITALHEHVRAMARFNGSD